MTIRTEIRALSPEETLPLRSDVLRPNQPIRESIYPGDDEATTQHWGAFVQNELVAIASLYPEPLPASAAYLAPANTQCWRLRGMAVSPQFQGQGYGRQLLEYCLCAVAERGGKVLWCNARSPAVGFYRGAGLETAGGEFIIPGIGPHFVMWRSVEC